MRVLVTDGDSRATLAITRSLGSKGHEVFVAGSYEVSLASRSRYCRKGLSYPNPQENRNQFVLAVLDLVEIHEIEILLPVTDICLLPIIRERSRFEKLCILPFASTRAIQSAADKVSVIRLATNVGIDVPDSIVLDNPEALGCLDCMIAFPIVIKPSKSRIEHSGGWVTTHVDYANSDTELHRKLNALPSGAYPVLLQERIHGPGSGVFYCFDNGEPVVSFAHRRLREKPPSGGVSVLRESVLPHPLAKEWGEKLLRELNWHGVAMVEFKLDSRDGRPKLMEINGRFWGSLQLAIDSGVDFPDLLVRLAGGESVAPIENYNTGIRSRWFWGEVDVLLNYLLKSKRELKLPKHHDSRLVSILKTVNPFVRGQKLEILRFGDLGPWLHESKKWFSR